MNLLHLASVTAALAAGVTGQRPAPVHEAASPVSAPIANVQYTVTFDTSLAAQRTIRVAMSFTETTAAPVILSLPSWTPGHYTILNFAKNVTRFAATTASGALRWDKVDYDTWRVYPKAAGQVTVSFDFIADALDDGSSWSRPDFGYFNGTNLFLYPEGRSLDFPATVTVMTSPGWRVTTSMHPVGPVNTYRETNYHDLVDMPVFVGRFDLDSAVISGKWLRFASYPAGTYQGAVRDSLERRMARVVPAEAAVTGETPWDSYSILMVFDSTFGGGSALEHQASHLALYGSAFARAPLDTIVTSITSHEIFHAWNVKRLRPAEMVPYRYAGPEPTPWLWVSEGITDYYADLAMVRARVTDSVGFAARVADKIGQVAAAPPTALADGSLTTWIGPRDGSGGLYYPKGSLAGLMLDIIIRDATDNHESLDHVMRNLYATVYKQHRGFTAVDWWSAVSKAAGGRSFTDFNSRYVTGRDPYPWAAILPLAGMRYATDTVRQAHLGVSTAPDSSGERVLSVVPGGTADRAHLQAGDYLVSVADITVHDPNWSTPFRAEFNGRAGTVVDIVVRRGGQNLKLSGALGTVDAYNGRIEFDPGASPKAVRIRHGILTGQ